MLFRRGHVRFIHTPAPDPPIRRANGTRKSVVWYVAAMSNLVSCSRLLFDLRIRVTPSILLSEAKSEVRRAFRKNALCHGQQAASHSLLHAYPYVSRVATSHIMINVSPCKKRAVVQAFQESVRVAQEARRGSRSRRCPQTPYRKSPQPSYGPDRG